ncbi:MAG TPA: hypothetical protein VMY78_10665 [Solirubrobacteraceae bacterium]|nr:hypothetical protein [Solirubrobacteraceae bacterium]
MLRRHALPVALLAAIAATAAAPAAEAKQISAVTACGADGCKSISRAVGQAMHDIGGPEIAGSPIAARYFRLAIHVGDGERTLGTSRVIYVPSSRTMGNDSGWSLVAEGTARKLNRALAGRAPLPASGFETASAAALATPEPESRPAEVFPPPESAIRAAAAVAAAEADSGSAPWWPFAAGALAAIGLLVLLRRLRRGRLTLAQH